MKKLGLLGYPLGHSFSKRYFEAFFAEKGISDYSYENFALEEIAMVPERLFSDPELRGFNVTIPYKEAIIPYLDALTPEAEAIGAVNCVRVDSDGRKIGYNTDAYGFERSLRTMLGEKKPEAFVLGTGGASKAVCYTLRKMGIAYRQVSRTGSGDVLSYGQLAPAMFRGVLIVNTTPLGMYPKTEAAPELPYEAVDAGCFLYDLVYNPADTLFTRLGRRQHALVKSGYDMLVAQAEKGWEIFSAL